MSGFSDPILDGSGSLTARDIAKSPGYVANTTGWGLYQNGNADLNNVSIRGTVVISNSGQSLLVYNGTPAFGNLILSIASVGGHDSHGNYYPQGLAGFQNLGTFNQIGEVNGAQTQATKFIQIQCDSSIQTIALQPDINTWNQGSVFTALGGGLTLTAPQLKTDTENAATIFLASANPASSGNASITFRADKHILFTTNDTVNLTINGAVQINPTNANNNANTAFICGQVGSGSVNWYRFASNLWGSDDSVRIPDGQGYFVGTGYDSVAAFASSRANATDDGFSVRVNGDSNSRWVVTSQGINHWGPGGATAIDTTIQREAATVMGVGNAWVKHGETWQTPSYNTNWATSTTFNGLTGLTGLQYRIDAEDNVWLLGCWKAGGTTPGAAVFNLPAGWRPVATQFIPALRNNGGTVSACGILVNSAGNVDVFSQGGGGPLPNNEYMIDAKFPLGNVS